MTSFLNSGTFRQAVDLMLFIWVYYLKKRTVRVPVVSEQIKLLPYSGRKTRTMPPMKSHMHWDDNIRHVLMHRLTRIRIIQTIGDYHEARSVNSAVDLKLFAGTQAEQQKALQDPAKVFDFVSYCLPRWMGIYNFMQILGAAQSRGYQYLSLKIENRVKAKKEWQYISFRIKQTAKNQELEIRNEFSVIRSNPIPPE